jgi:hypothetical protein
MDADVSALDATQDGELGRLCSQLRRLVTDCPPSRRAAALAQVRSDVELALLDVDIARVTGTLAPLPPIGAGHS